MDENEGKGVEPGTEDHHASGQPHPCTRAGRHIEAASHVNIRPSMRIHVVFFTCRRDRLADEVRLAVAEPAGHTRAGGGREGGVHRI